MVIDLFTLYIVVLLKSATLSLLWFAIWRAYGDIAPARYWLGANLCLTVGGAVMALESWPGVLSQLVLGNVIPILGYFLYWVGVHRFYDRRPLWLAVVLGMLACGAVLLLFEDSATMRNATFLAGQTTPLVLAAGLLVREGRESVGARFSAYTMAVLVGSMLARFVALGAHEAGVIDEGTCCVVLFCAQIAAIFSGLLLNFGFLLMVIDRLHAEASALAGIDELTGVANRRSMLARLDEEVRLSARSGRGFALMMVDIDRFKGINDRCGHAAGDACLAHFGSLARARLRAGDLVARMGGDEFCLLLPETDRLQACRIAADLVAAVRAAPVVHGGRTIPMTVSVGVAVWDGGKEAGTAKLIEEADRALYWVKRRGRNDHALAEPAAVQRGAGAAAGLAG